MKAFGNIAKDSQVRAVASGALPSGKPVIVNSDGTVSVVSETASSAGSEQDSGVTGGGGWVTSALPNTSAFVGFAQSDNGNSNYGTAIVGTVSGSTITYGTKAQATTMTYPELPNVIGMTSTTFVIVYKNSSASNRGEARVGTISGTGASATISFGSAVTFESGQTTLNQVHSVDRLTDTKFVIAFQDASDNGKAKCIIGTVSGTSVSFGSAATFSTANTSLYTSVSALSETKFVAIWSNTPTPEAGKVIIGTVSGTSISYGSAETYDSDRVVRHSVVAVSDSKFVIAYNDNRLSTNYGTAIAGTVSGTSITLGTPVVWRSSAEGNAYPSIVKITSDSFVIVGLNDDARGSIFEGSLSGTTITFGSSPIQFKDTSGTEFWATLVNNEKVVIGYDSTNLSASVYTPLTSTLTSENYIGMSSGTAFQTGSDTSVGSETEFITNMGNEISAGVYDPDNNKVILAYSDQDTGVDGTAIVGTVSGTSISFGTPTVYNTSETTHIGITYDTTNDKVVIVYRDGAGNNNYGNAIVGTVSGTSISFGTAAVYNTATTQFNVAAFDSNTGKVVIIYQDTGGAIQSKVATVSGTSISFGSEVQVGGSNSNYTAVVFDSNSNKVVVVFRDGSNSNYGTARVGTVSGTDISYGTAVVFNSGSSEDIHCAFDSSNNKVVIGYKDGGDSDKGNCIVGTVSGTSISFGSEVTFHNASTNGMDDVVYNSNLGKVFFFYRNSTTIGKVVSGTVSGTAVGSLSSEFTYHNASTNVPFQVYDVASTNIVAAYRDAGDSNKGKAVVVKPDDRATTRAEVADGGKAVIDSTNAISRNQIGLTAGQTYFVQGDGTIGLTADSPSVTAGTAISATELIVKG